MVNNCDQWHLCTPRMALAQGAIRRIIHDHKRCFALDAKFEDAHNVWMDQAGNPTSFSAKIVHVVAGNLGMQYLDGGLSAKMNMFSEIDFSETAFSQQLDKLIVAHLL